MVLSSTKTFPPFTVIGKLFNGIKSSLSLFNNTLHTIFFGVRFTSKLKLPVIFVATGSSISFPFGTRRFELINFTTFATSK